MNAMRLETLPLAFAAAALLASASAAAPLGSEKAAMTLIRAYNDRPIPSAGWRRVTLDLWSGERITRSFSIVNIWSDLPDENGLGTLFLLELPTGLSGTSYLLKEERDRARNMEVFLHLPAGLKQVLSVEPSRFGEGLLGSDFGYRDLRWLLPVEGFRFRTTGQVTLIGHKVAVVEVEPTAERRNAVFWGLARLFIGRDPLFLFGADYYILERKTGPERKTGEWRLSKRMRVESLAQIDGQWIATEMTMRGDGERSSKLTLNEVHFASTPRDPSLFVPENLPRIAARVRARETAALLVGRGP